MNFGLILALFLVVPLIEIWVLIQVGGLIGALPTIALVVLTAVTGVSLLRWQGLGVIDRLRRQLDQGVLPAVEIVEGAMLLIAGALLLTPGFATDLVGFALLMPPLRQHWAARLVAPEGWLWRKTAGGSVHVIEGEYRRVDPGDNDDGQPK